MGVGRGAAAMIAVLTAIAVSACSTTAGSETTPPSRLPESTDTVPPPPALDDDLAAVGAVLYEQYCAACHGGDLAGDPNWRTPNPDGSYPPPPHDSSGHTWHHPDRLLVDIIRDGSGFAQARMPTFGGLLDDDEILSILEFLKTHWGHDERAFQWEVTWRDRQREP
jgi:mono/diheme cytochrome c family protein